MWYVYLLKSQKQRWYYVGSTDELERRLNEHNEGRVISTKHYRPLTIVFKKEFAQEKEAREYERMIKDRRIIKEGIIRTIEGR
jgi:putative endonuclease